MEPVNIRQKLQYYIDMADEELLKMLYDMAKKYNYNEEEEDDDLEYELREDEIKTFEENRQKRLNGESKLYSWEEAGKLITEKLK